MRALTKAVMRRDEKLYFGAALTCSVLANIHRDEKKRAQPYTPNDFMPKFGKQTVAKQSWKDQLAFAEAVNKAFGGKDKRKQVNTNG